MKYRPYLYHAVVLRTRGQHWRAPLCIYAVPSHLQYLCEQGYQCIHASTIPCKVCMPAVPIKGASSVRLELARAVCCIYALTLHLQGLGEQGYPCIHASTILCKVCMPAVPIQGPALSG